MTDTQLNTWQQTFVEEALRADPPARFLLVGPTGTGKSTAAMELVRRLAADSRGFRLLLLHPNRTTGLNLLARVAKVAGLQTRLAGKDWLRTIASSDQPYMWPSRIAIGVNARSLRDEWVQRALSETTWDMVIADEVAVEPATVWLEQLGASRAIVLASSFEGQAASQDWATTVWMADQLPGASAQTMRETLEFESSREEVALLGLVDEAAAIAEGHEDWGVAELRRAAGSSAYALQAAALRISERLRPLRNSYAHGRTTDEHGVPEERQLSLSRILPYFAQLESIIQGVDALEFDSRFEAFFGLVVERLTSGGAPFAVFTADQRTAEYVADRLRFMQRDVELIGAGWTPSVAREPSTAYVVSDDALQGLDLGSVSIGVHYDAVENRQALREGRLSRDGARTLISLRDLSSS